jgi:hypothetical protein
VSSIDVSNMDVEFGSVSNSDVSSTHEGKASSMLLSSIKFCAIKHTYSMEEFCSVVIACSWCNSEVFSISSESECWWWSGVLGILFFRVRCWLWGVVGSLLCSDSTNVCNVEIMV